MAKEETKNYVRSKIYTNGNHEVSAQNTVEALDKMIDDSDNVEQQVATLGAKVGELVGGETKSEPQDSEYFSGPQKYGFWVEKKGSKTKIYCQDVEDGSYQIWFASAVGSLGSQFNVVFKNGYCEITRPSLNANYYRLIVSNIDVDSKLYYIETEEGKIGDLSKLQTTDKSNLVNAINEVKETAFPDAPKDGNQYVRENGQWTKNKIAVDAYTKEESDKKYSDKSIEAIVNGGEIIDETFTAELAKNSTTIYAFYIPKTDWKSTTLYSPLFKSGNTMQVVFCYSNKDVATSATTITSDEGYVVIPKRTSTGHAYARVIAVAPLSFTSSSYSYTAKQVQGLVDTKQDKLTDEQQDAVNSGVNSSIVDEMKKLAGEVASHDRSIIELLGGEYVDRECTAEYFSGPQKYGFWVEDNESGTPNIGGITKIHCSDIPDGEYKVWSATSKGNLGFEKSIVFSEGYAVIERTSIASNYYRVITNGINENSICYCYRFALGITNENKENIEINKTAIESLEKDSRLRTVLDYSTGKCAKYLADYKRGSADTCYRINFLMYTDFNPNHYSKYYPNVNLQIFSDTMRWFEDAFVDESICAILCNGDMVCGIPSYSDKEHFKGICDDLVERVSRVNKPFIFVQGNHDTAEDFYWSYDASTRCTKDDVRNWLYKPLMARLKEVVGADKVHESTDASAWYYYVDLYNVTDAHGKVSSVRIFAMNEYDCPRILLSNGQIKYTLADGNGLSGGEGKGFNSYYSKMQLQMLIDALKSCPENTLFVTMNHINIDTKNATEDGRCYGSVGGSKEAFYAIIKAWRTNSSGSATVQALTDESGNVVVNAYTINFDFTSSSGTHPYIHTKGHNHNTVVQFESELSAYSFMGVCGDGDGSPSHIKMLNSITQYGVDIMSVKNNWTAYFLRFGYAFNPSSTVEDSNGFRYIDNPINLLKTE